MATLPQPTKFICTESENKAPEKQADIPCSYCRKVMRMEIPANGLSYQYECIFCDCVMEIHGHGGYHINVVRPASDLFRALYKRA